MSVYTCLIGIVSPKNPNNQNMRSSGHRNSRYDNSVGGHGSNNLVPFHTQMFEEGSINEDSKKVENINLEDLDKEKEDNKIKKFEHIEKLDLKTINSFLPSIHLSKNGNLLFMII